MLTIALIAGYILCGFVGLVIAYKTNTAEDSAGIIVLLWPLCLWILLLGKLDGLAKRIANVL